MFRAGFIERTSWKNSQGLRWFLLCTVRQATRSCTRRWQRICTLLAKQSITCRKDTIHVDQIASVPDWAVIFVSLRKYSLRVLSGNNYNPRSEPGCLVAAHISGRFHPRHLPSANRPRQLQTGPAPKKRCLPPGGPAQSGRQSRPRLSHPSPARQHFPPPTHARRKASEEAALFGAAIKGETNA